MYAAVGRAAVIDLVSPADPAIALTYNHLESLRDRSHVRALAADEMERLMREAGLKIVHRLPEMSRLTSIAGSI